MAQCSMQTELTNLTRSQPPFLTSMIRCVYEDKESFSNSSAANAWLEGAYPQQRNITKHGHSRTAGRVARGWLDTTTSIAVQYRN